MSRTVLALSPHLDDAAFSAGGLLARLAAGGDRVILATVFTGNVARPTGFALACQLDKGLAPDADYMALRRAEDEAACAALGAEPLHLPHLEAPHRGYEDAPSLFGGVRTEDREEAAVAETLRSAFGGERIDLLLLPRGIGGHVDHEVVRRAGGVLDAKRRLYWTDWPYADREAPKAPFAAEDGRLLSETVTLTPREADAKLAACLAYETQLGFQFGGAEALRERLAGIQSETYLA
ncbi:PIG-L family deacetylase [Parvularcula dongshanensis]|uniref:LmbE family N-acetylglucosaminyl deacetylase n=1 Tax=Parvularcula dongshanensis TaxID=1173995 RepID=A0A840I0P2_9PROT|nr:LmbE family N-acetylglucosaminyl deacetylase [Parvularcula dongshanensis]